MWTALLSLLPLILRIANMILDKNAATEAEKKEVMNLIMKSKDDSLTGVQFKDEFQALRDKLKARTNKV